MMGVLSNFKAKMDIKTLWWLKNSSFC